MTGLPRTLIARDDVRFFWRQPYLYLCSSNATLRIPENHLTGNLVTTGSIVSWEALSVLPDGVLTQLIRRDLVHAPDGTEPEASVPEVENIVQVLGDGSFGALVAHLLRKKSLKVIHHTHTPASAEPATVIVPLGADEDELVGWTTFARERGATIVGHLCSPTRIVIALLRPAETACPQCVVTRLRANYGWHEITDLPIGTLFGVTEDPRDPGTTLAAGLVGKIALTANRITAPVGTLWQFDLNDMALSSHRLLHVPYCRACGELTRFASGVSGWRDEGEPELAAVEESPAVDPLVGIIARIEVSPPDRSAGGLYRAVTVGRSDTRLFSPAEGQTLGGAVKFSAEQARNAAFGEALERYALGIYSPGDLIRATGRSLGDKAIDPRKYPLGSPEEYRAVRDRIARYDPDVEIEWTTGTSLLTGRERYVPACMVYVPYIFPSRRERLLRPISTGAAAGPGYAWAIRSALLEIIERDAFAITWNNRLEVPTIELDTLPAGPARTIFGRLTANGIRILCKETTTDLGIPAILISSRQTDGAQLIVAHSTRAATDHLTAIQGALEELEQSRESVRNWLAANGIPPADRRLRAMEDFFSYYSDPNRLRHLEFLERGRRVSVAPLTRPDGTPIAAQVGQILDRVEAAGHDVIAVDITPVDVFECGIRVVRCIVPGLQPVSFSMDFRHRGGRRQYDAPVRMGIRPHPLTEAELNQDPMPGG